MPPIRSITAATKPIKTERTHEENQERAYIAASRRSDRSLEARIESARRASEIHKRRTGRSLRVTEQDVVNEEMYEEEDDDLPMQYRRLTAHLNSNSSDFNRRLASYLTNHVAMRNALGQAISNSYAQQQNPSQPSPSNPVDIMQQPWSPSPGLAQYTKQMFAQQQQQPMLQRQPSNQRPAPYPSPSTPGYRPQLNPQQQDGSGHTPKSNSLPVLQHTAPTPTLRPEDRRASAPVVARNGPPGSNASRSQRLHKSSSASSLPNIDVREQDESEYATQPAVHSAVETSFPPHPQGWIASPSLSLSPLTTALPLESQMFLNSTFESHDAFGNPIGADEKMQQPYYPSPEGSNCGQNYFNRPYVDGMSQTLAPGPFEDRGQFNWLASDGESMATPSSGFNFGMDQTMSGDGFEQKGLFLPESVAGGQLTPADHDWAALIDTNSWDDDET